MAFEEKNISLQELISWINGMAWDNPLQFAAENATFIVSENEVERQFRREQSGIPDDWVDLTD